MKVRDITERFILTAATFLLFTFLRDRLGLVDVEDYLILVGVLLSFYFAAIPVLFWLFRKILRAFNKLVPKIGILNGYIKDASKENKCVPKSANITGIVWERELRKALQEITLKRIRTVFAEEIDASFALILNPYGENYPESDKNLRSTFQRIRSYISNGGVFFATGAPFWYHQNTVTDREGEWSVIRTIDGFQNMEDGLCFAALGLSVTMHGNEPLEIEVYQRDRDQLIVGDILTSPITTLKRWRAILPRTPDCLPLLREKEDKTYPLCAIQYDKGFILHSGLWIEDEDSSEFKVVVRTLQALVKGRFKQIRPWPTL